MKNKQDRRSEPQKPTAKRGAFAPAWQGKRRPFRASVMIFCGVGLFASITAFFGAAAVFFDREASRAPAAAAAFGEQQARLFGVFGVTALFLTGFLVTCALIFAWRVQRSVDRMVEHMRAVGAGKTYSGIAVRKSDPFPEVAEAFNEAVRTGRDVGRKVA